MKIYLAGKMDATHGAWRDAIIDPFYDHEARRYRPRWELVLKGDFYDSEQPSAFVWPRTPNDWVFGLHEYIGPYRATWLKDWDSKYGGYFHGTPCLGQHGVADQEDSRTPVVANCIDALQRADLVFAYLNSPDCFGTLAELGMARALGKFTYLAVGDDAEWDWGDYWFIEHLVSAVGRGAQWGREMPEQESERLRWYVRDAFVQWSGRPGKESPLSLVRASGATMEGVAREAAQSFSQIARWSADPRVREEAQRMLRRITG